MFTDYKCEHLKKEYGKKYHAYCDSYSKDARRCCPEACENRIDFTERVCKASKGTGKCIYPNEAQCGKIYSGRISMCRKKRS